MITIFPALSSGYNTFPNKAPTLIVGRGLLVDYENKAIFGLDEDDPLLRNSNIEDYMNDCLSQFIEVRADKTRHSPPIQYPFPDLLEAFINPFASLGIRDLPPELIVTLVEGLIENGVRKINISNGVEHSEKDKALISRIKILLKDKPVEIEYHWF